MKRHWSRCGAAVVLSLAVDDRNVPRNEVEHSTSHIYPRPHPEHAPSCPASHSSREMFNLAVVEVAVRDAGRNGVKDSQMCWEVAGAHITCSINHRSRAHHLLQALTIYFTEL
jgi:hypothetical protein